MSDSNGLNVVILCVFAPIFASAATNQDARSAQLLAGALTALNGSTNLADVTLSGQASYTSGLINESGTATLQAKGDMESLLSLALNGDARKEIRNGYEGDWSGTDSVSHPISFINCVTPAAWFAPNLLVESAASSTNYSAEYVGAETLNEAPVEHLRIARVAPGPGTAYATLLGSADLYLDSSSMLPVALAFNQHPDTNSLVNLAVEVLFGDYQNFGGV